MEIFLPFGCALLVDEKSAPRCTSRPPNPFARHLIVLQTQNVSFAHFFGDRFVGKEDDLRTYSTSSPHKS
jgi:hypothetical protein